MKINCQTKQIIQCIKLQIVPQIVQLIPCIKKKPRKKSELSKFDMDSKHFFVAC